MGFFEKLLRPTPFYNYYKQFLKKREERRHERLETVLHPLRVKFYRQFLKPSDVVFDVGANVGNRVVSFLECDANVVAVEPQPECVKILRSKFNDQIQIENVGLGETEGELEMHISNDSTISTFSQEYIENTKDRFKYSQWVDTIKVPIVTLDSLIEKYGTPRFCKIDVEGYELHVLKGLHRKIPFLSLEYCVPEMKTELADCINYLHKLSPAGEFNYSIGESMQWAKQDWQSFEEFTKHMNSNEFVNTSFGDIYFRSN